MLDQLSPTTPQQSSGAKDDTIQKEVKLSSTAESDGDTTLSMTSSEDDESPTSDVRKVSAQVRGKRISRTSISRPEGYSPAKRLSSISASDSIDVSKDHVPSPALLSGMTTKRTTAVSKRTSGGWDTLARKSTSYRNNTSSTRSVGSKSSTRKSAAGGKGNAKDDLIAKLNKQVELLQEKQKKIDSSHQKTTQNLEAKLDDLRVADSILIGQLRTERNELKDQLDQANDRIQSIGEEQEQLMQKELAAKRVLEQQLAEAHSRIQNLSEQAVDDHFGGSKIDVLREKRRAIEAQLAGGSGGNADSRNEVQTRNKHQSSETMPQSPVVEVQKSQAHVDMERVIMNLRDELKASKQVIVHQKEQLRLVLESQEADENESSKTTPDVNEDGWKARFQELQKRHLKLECDRAWSEFQLRGRITADSLKFNRRLLHWKQQVGDLEGKLSTLQMLRERVNGAHEVEQKVPVEGASGATDQSPPRRGWWGRR